MGLFQSCYLINSQWSCGELKLHEGVISRQAFKNIKQKNEVQMQYTGLVRISKKKL